MKRQTFWLGIILGFFFFFLTIKNTNSSEVFFILINANLLPIIIGFLFLGSGLVLKSIRWQILLDSAIPILRIFNILTIGYLVNNLLPARAGEIARIYLAGKKEKVGVSKTTGSIVVERILDTLILTIILICILFKQPFLQKDFRFYFAGIAIPDQWKSRFKLFFSSFKILKNKKNLVSLICLSLLIWVIEAFWNYSLLYSLGLKLPLAAAFFLAAVVNLGLFIPSPPGYIGVFHFLATFALLSWGVDKSQALSYAILQHGLEYLILTGLGLWSTIQLSFNPFVKNKWQNV